MHSLPVPENWGLGASGRAHNMGGPNIHGPGPRLRRIFAQYRRVDDLYICAGINRLASALPGRGLRGGLGTSGVVCQQLRYPVSQTQIETRILQLGPSIWTSFRPMARGTLDTIAQCPGRTWKKPSNPKGARSNSSET